MSAPDALAIATGDVVRVEGREGYWRVWHPLPTGRVMIEDGPGMAHGPYVALEVYKPVHRVSTAEGSGNG